MILYHTEAQHLAPGLVQSRDVEDKSLSLALPLCDLIQVVWLIQFQSLGSLTTLQLCRTGFCQVA